MNSIHDSEREYNNTEIFRATRDFYAALLGAGDATEAPGLLWFML